jgi:hypothetical protein
MPEHELAALVGGRWRIALDESWEHESPDVRNPDQIWYEQVPCQGGAFISLYCLYPPTLKLSTPRPRNAQEIFRALKDTPGVKADFHFDNEAVILFPPAAIHVVAPLAGAKRKRALSEDHKTQLTEGRKKLGMTSQKKGQKAFLIPPKSTLF